MVSVRGLLFVLTFYPSDVVSRLSARQKFRQELSETREMDRPDHVHIGQGLTHLWTTPVLREILVGPECEIPADLLTCIENAVLRRFRAFSKTCDLTSRPLSDEGETVNDRFFDMQREAWEAGGPTFLDEAVDSGGSCEELEVLAFRALRAAWLDRIYTFVSKAASVDVAVAMFAEASSMQLFVWASVHEAESAHVAHDHENAAVSGVFYISTPPHSGSIRFEDPRVARLYWAQSPFNPTPLAHSPTAGELLLFPPWLVHSVGSSEGAGAPRISLSFNVLTPRVGSEDLTALVNSAVFVPPS
jgi:uncharacterized protein (TIGR02466 family)